MLSALKQTTTVEEFREKFELYANPLRETNLEYLKGIFLNGLKEEIKVEIKLHPMITLVEMMNYAQIIDEKNQALTNGGMVMQGYGKLELKRVPLAKIVSYGVGNKGNSQVRPLGENRAIDSTNNGPIRTTRSKVGSLRG